MQPLLHEPADLLDASHSREAERLWEYRTVLQLGLTLGPRLNELRPDKGALQSTPDGMVRCWRVPGLHNMPRGCALFIGANGRYYLRRRCLSGRVPYYSWSRATIRRRSLAGLRNLRVQLEALDHRLEARYTLKSSL